MDVTVITPTIPGREDLLEECIESVKNQLLPATAHLWAVDYDKRGPAFMRNQLVSQATTEWVTFLDDDDLMLPEHLLLHSAFVDEADVVTSWSYIVHRDGGQALFDTGHNPERILSGHNTMPVTASVRRESFLSVGGFKEHERFEDWALWRDLTLAGARFQNIERVTWHYRIQPLGRNHKE